MSRSVSCGVVRALLVAFALMCFAGYAIAETLVETSSETRFQLDLHVPDAALAAFLPAGWTSNAATQGAAKDANLRARVHRPRHDQRARWEAGRQGIKSPGLPCRSCEGSHRRCRADCHRRTDRGSCGRAGTIRQLPAGDHAHDAALHFFERRGADTGFAGLGICRGERRTSGTAHQVRAGRRRTEAIPPTSSSTRRRIRPSIRSPGRSRCWISCGT